MNNTMLKKLKKKPKWEIAQERSELRLQQQKLRIETEVYTKTLSGLKDDYNIALKAEEPDGENIAYIENQISTIEDKIIQNDKRYKANAEVLEIYSKIVKNDREGNASTRNSAVGVITGIGGLVLAGFGLKKAYESDMEGTLVNKKTLDWAKSLPILRNFGKH